MIGAGLSVLKAFSSAPGSVCAEPRNVALIPLLFSSRVWSCIKLIVGVMTMVVLPA